MLDAELEELRRATLARFASAVSLEDLEEARVEALGRKGHPGANQQGIRQIRAGRTRASGKAAELR